MKLKVFIDSKIPNNMSCLFDKAKIFPVKHLKSADICLIEAVSSPQNQHKNTVIFLKNHSKQVFLGSFISPLICPYTQKLIGALTNNNKILKVLSNKIYIKKATRREAELMISYWNNATSFFRTLASLQTSLMKTINMNQNF